MERINCLSDAPITPHPSTRSSQYRGGHLRRANIFVEDEIPIHVSQYADNNVSQDIINNNDDKLRQISGKL
jgi:hypothetical protein